MTGFNCITKEDTIGPQSHPECEYSIYDNSTGLPTLSVRPRSENSSEDRCESGNGKEADDSLKVRLPSGPKVNNHELSSWITSDDSQAPTVDQHTRKLISLDSECFPHYEESDYQHHKHYFQIHHANQLFLLTESPSGDPSKMNLPHFKGDYPHYHSHYHNAYYHCDHQHDHHYRQSSMKSSSPPASSIEQARNDSLFSKTHAVNPHNQLNRKYETGLVTQSALTGANREDHRHRKSQDKLNELRVRVLEWLNGLDACVKTGFQDKSFLKRS